MKLTLRGVVFSALLLQFLSYSALQAFHCLYTCTNYSTNTSGHACRRLARARYGFFSMILVVILTAVGFPLLHGNGGLGIVLGPTGGFIMIWPISAMLIGMILPRIRVKGVMGYIAAFLVLEIFGSLLLYLAGVPWLMYKVPSYTFEKR